MSKKEISSSTEKIEEYFTLSLDTFLYNAGILGFIDVIKKSGAKENKDYKINGQELKVSKDFLPKADLTQGYIDAVCEKFQNNTRIYKFCSFNIINSDVIKQYEKIFDGKTIETICNIVNDKQLLELIDEFQKSKKDNEENRIKIFTKIKDYLNSGKNKKLKNYLILSNIAINKLSLVLNNFTFLRFNGSSNSYYIEKEKDLYESLNTNCFNILSEYINTTKQEKYNCISCGANTSNGMDTTFLYEVGVDTGKKKSAFWNQNADSFLCPLCNFVYACSPIGFIDLDGTLIFVNQNDSIGGLQSMNETIEFIEGEKKNAKYTLYNTIIQRALKIKTKEVNSIQVVIRNEKHYTTNIIAKDILEIIEMREKDLEIISSIILKNNADEYIDIFDICLQNIFNNRNQWNLMFSILKSDCKNFSILNNILKIQLTQKYNFMEGINVKEKIDKSFFASKAGDEIRKKLTNLSSDKRESDTDKKEEQDADNKLRGLVYQIVNAVHTGNRDLFLSITTRLYTSLNLPIPTIFMDIFKNDDTFKEIGYAYLIGIKGGFYKKENENKGE